MKRCILASISLLLAASAPAVAQKKTHLAGREASELVSLLASGNKTVKELLGKGATEIVVHEFMVLSEATFKYDPDAPIFKLPIYAASGKVGATQNSTEFGEATALFRFLTGLGFKPETSLQGGDIMIATIVCKIDVKADIAADRRFQCDLTQ
jgi:hypothetical protein